MLKVLIPLCGNSEFFDQKEFFFPKMLIEISGKSMIEHSIENLMSLTRDVFFIFIVKKSDCNNFHLDEILITLTNGKCKIIYLDKNTKGAACTSLLAIEYIEKNNELIIANFDQIINQNLNELYNQFSSLDIAAGCLVFNATHPRWSYVTLDNNEYVLEAAEKRPISRNAIAGFYYFKTGEIFINSAKKMILKFCAVYQNFYISLIFNEIILENKKIKALRLQNEKFSTFYTPQKIREYEKISFKSND